MKFGLTSLEQQTHKPALVLKASLSPPWQRLHLHLPSEAVLLEMLDFTTASSWEQASESPWC